MVITIFILCETTLRREIHAKVALVRIFVDGVAIACGYTHAYASSLLNSGKKVSSIILVVTLM